jgi:hypothetical protein
MTSHVIFSLRRVDFAMGINRDPFLFISTIPIVGKQLHKAPVQSLNAFSVYLIRDIEASAIFGSTECLNTKEMTDRFTQRRS